MLNSARRHCTAPRRGRLVEWSEQRRGNVRLHFRSRRSCRRCACDASQESVGNAGSIDVTTTDNPLVIDHWRRSQFVFWKLMLLVSALFAFFCYKRQLASVGDALLETQPKDAGKPTTEG